MTGELRKGDRITWRTPQGRTTGVVERKLTSDEQVGNEGQEGQLVRASDEDPRYVVRSDKTGKVAAHKADALDKRG